MEQKQRGVRSKVSASSSTLHHMNSLIQRKHRARYCFSILHTVSDKASVGEVQTRQVRNSITLFLDGLSSLADMA